MVAVVVEAGAVLHRRRHPDGGEAEILDVVELGDQTLEVATPLGIPRLVAIPVVVVVAGIAIIEAGSQQEVDALGTKIAARHPLLADAVLEALLALIAAGVDGKGTDHQIGATPLVTRHQGLACIAGRCRGGLAAVRREMHGGGAVLIVAHPQGDGLAVHITPRGRGGRHRGGLQIGPGQRLHLDGLAQAVKADAITGVGADQVILGRIRLGPVPLVVNLEAGVVAAKGLLGAEGGAILTGHGGEPPVVGRAPEVPAVAALSCPDHHAHAAAALGALIVGDREAIGEGAGLGGVDDDALRGFAAAPQIARDLAVGIRGVAAAQGERRPLGHVHRPPRGNDRERRLVVIPKGGDAVGQGLIVDLDAHRAHGAPEDVAVTVAVAKVDGPVASLIKLEALARLAIQVGFHLPQVIPYQGHGEAGPAVEGAAHVELRQGAGKPRGLATGHRRRAHRLGARVDADLVRRVGIDPVVGRRVALLPVAVSVYLEARAAAGIPAHEALASIKIDAVRRRHGGRRPSIRGAPEEPLRRRARRRDQGSQQSGREYPSSH